MTQQRIAFAISVLVVAAVIAAVSLILLSTFSTAARTCRASDGGHWNTATGTCTWSTP